MGKESDEKFERLISRFFENQIVPFIGAGVSYDAKPDGNNGNNKSSIKTSFLKRKLAEQLKELKRNGPQGQREWIEWFCNTVVKCKEENKCKCTQLSCAQLPQDCGMVTEEGALFTYLCEVYDWISSGDNDIESLCNVLNIGEFTSFTPTFAHRYIAFLARERLIDEIITTNYDDLIEKAYRDTFDREVFGTDGSGLLGVCTDISEYRNKRRNTGSNHDKSYNCYLRVYKINGCACKFNQNGGVSGKKSEILLTEKQLQDWRERQWAKDLFKDRLRSSTILFSGFGSDEPQVRHTVLQVIEEFSSYEDLQFNEKPDLALSEPNWPSSLFMVGYNTDLTFNQMQILYGYIKSSIKSDRTVTIEEIYRNAFTAKDLNFFDDKGANEENDKLDSDLFWKRVFQAAYWRLVKEYCGEDSPVYSFLSAITPRADMLLSAMLDWYIPKDKPFGAFPELLELSKEKDNVVLPITDWAYRISNNTDAPSGFYIPLHEEPVLIVLMLILIFVIATEDPNHKVIEKQITWEQLKEKIFTSENMFGFKVMVFSGEEEFILLLENGSVSALHNYQKVILPKDFKYNVIIQLFIPDSICKPFEPNKIMCMVDDESDELKSFKYVPVYRISINTIFERWHSGGIDELYKQLSNIITDRSAVKDESQPHLHSRAERI